MLTVQELNDIRDRVREHLNVRRDQGEIKIIISSGTTAIACGSRELMSAALDEMDQLNTSGVLVQQRDLEVDLKDQPALLIIDGEKETLVKRATAVQVRQLIRRYSTQSVESADS